MTDLELFDATDAVINKDIRPFIEADGGRIQLKRIKDGIVFVELAGACAGCPGAVMTLKGGVERILQTKLDGIKEVRLDM